MRVFTCECCGLVFQVKSVHAVYSHRSGFVLCLACQGAYNLIHEKPEHANIMNSWLKQYKITEDMIKSKLDLNFWKDILPTR